MDNLYEDVLIPYEHLFEDEFQNLKVEDTRDAATSKNYFDPKPKGIIIQDSFNNFAFPVRPAPQIDTNKTEFPILLKRFREFAK